MRRRVYVWEIPVRLTHWLNVLSIVVLSFTGYYISNPYINVSPREPLGAYFMGTMRFVHFAFAFIFVASLVLRTYWAFAGNQWASWRGLFPFLTAEGRRNALHAAQYYFFLRRDPPEVAGHNALAGTTYMIIVFLYGVIVFTGFTLYGQLHPVGIWYRLTNWVLAFVTLQDMRLIHHAVMWLLICFALYHIYVAWLIDLEEGNGLMSSIFSGFKFLPRHQQPDWIEQSPTGESGMLKHAAVIARKPVEIIGRIMLWFTRRRHRRAPVNGDAPEGLVQSRGWQMSEE
ncbi:MAG: Ni/Fe-hydrogenase, b-type cytochrome subunit [Chloroflexi bacterium]|nr:Ni/Fe-hydrogenase, b-type cytochrome subunit [Chloroflexota bacterium]